MTRREFVIKNYGGDVVDDEVFGGIQGCPAHYKKLVEVDKSITGAKWHGSCSAGVQITNDICTKCWNEEIPGTKKTRPHGFRLEKEKAKVVEQAELSVKEAIDRAGCECDTCAHQDLCRFECPFRDVTKAMYQHCIEEIARYNIASLGIQMLPLHCKRYEESPDIEALNQVTFQLKAQDLTQEMVRKIFDMGSKEKK